MTRRRYARPPRGLRRRDRRSETPLMLVADDRYPGESLEALARWTYRYRSELAPLVLGAGTGVAGWYLHSHYPNWWPAVAGTAAALALVVGTHGRSWLDRTIERAYAAAVLLYAGAWLAAATALGPGAASLPGLLLLGTLAGALPWWGHRRRRARVRVERTLEAWPQIAEAVGLTGSRVMSAVVDLWGWRARIALRKGQTAADVVNKLPALESGLGTRPGAVRVEADPARADRVTVRVLDRDPHAEPIPWPGPAAYTIAAPVVLGLFEDATPIRVPLLRRHALIGGVAGAGKSGVLNAILAALSACRDVVLWGIDLKRGMELRPWARCLDRLATTPADAAALLADAERILDTRADALARHGARVWEPTPDAPALVIVTDEYAELDEDATGHADSIARRGRAVAVTLLAATQRPTQEAMGKGAVRSQMDVRICLRVRERRDVDLILGQGMLAAGWHAHTLDAPGKFLVSAPGLDTPRRGRAYLLTDSDVSTITTRHASRRTRLDPLSANAANQARTADDQDGEVIDAEIVTEAADDPETALWSVLRQAPAEGLSVPDLMTTTGMGRTWTYDRLQQHADAGRAYQVTRGRWRALTTPGVPPMT